MKNSHESVTIKFASIIRIFSRHGYYFARVEDGRYEVFVPTGNYCQPETLAGLPRFAERSILMANPKVGDRIAFVQGPRPSAGRKPEALQWCFASDWLAIAPPKPASDSAPMKPVVRPTRMAPPEQVEAVAADSADQTPWDPTKVSDAELITAALEITRPANSNARSDVRRFHRLALRSA